MDQTRDQILDRSLDRSPASAPLRALADAFHAMIARSRAEPAADLAERLDRLARLRAVVADNEERFRQAISADFGHRSAVETTIAETMMVYSEIRHATKHLKSWMAPQRIATALQFLPARNRLIPQPLGVVGIIAPWNYPLQLTLAPAIGAIAAGNLVMIKPSELVPHFAGLLKETVAARFDATELLVTGVEDEIAKAFASLPFDHLVFTGSTRVGRLVAEAAGRNLTPVTLELGGKSPAIIDASADLDEAAERIAYGKLLNAGQTCIAPDYVLVPERSLQAFAEKLRAQMRRMFGTDPANKDYTSVISDRHYARLEGLVADAVERGAKILQPARADDPNWKAHRKFPPTLILGATEDMAVMQEEIFGPVLPVLGYREPADAIAFVNRRDRPLALYWFGKDRDARDAVLSRTVSGGVTVNDCLFHFAQVNQPMGGVGASGTGAYHGEWGFRTFSKLKPVFYRSKFNRLADLYPPYGGKIARLEKMMRFMS
ncbi:MULTISPECIES: coniferyl aldehyde dehydrogenase [Bradyrhizobium]|nr:coniferyl aldehyde dehydrogenase [Bradyrhizobium diazoefficiens]MBP1061702.1 coniferyl-aldehyde dehydrogenase [Bradyrhizobium japonicum]AND92768.1 aldehyde dehydrogenase [Bradyrhizobium diazoefficiens USDA 110]AWO94669.2 coniferyl aldehyde dehydrogenase [Bradyrhizobium diazoefficiens]QLD40561.1 coniferyl aldehyde dehydrogenase [Bradyrhizobium diazoefficiens]WLA74900.1 coniferyl aldehyde dehydrogenase [Bradyrhizobium diazoefficiens]